MPRTTSTEEIAAVLSEQRVKGKVVRCGIDGIWALKRVEGGRVKSQVRVWVAGCLQLTLRFEGKAESPGFNPCETEVLLWQTPWGASPLTAADDVPH